MLEFNFNYEVLSAIAGVTFWSFYFQWFAKSIRSAQVIEFLQHLKRYLRRPVLRRSAIRLPARLFKL